MIKTKEKEAGILKVHFTGHVLGLFFKASDIAFRCAAGVPADAMLHDVTYDPNTRKGVIVYTHDLTDGVAEIDTTFESYEMQ